MAPLILNLDTRGSISFTAWSLYTPGKSPRYPLSRGLDEPQSRSGGIGKATNLFAPGGNRTQLFGPPAGSQVSL
jgi:hypothetical protein